MVSLAYELVLTLPTAAHSYTEFQLICGLTSPPVEQANAVSKTEDIPNMVSA